MVDFTSILIILSVLTISLLVINYVRNSVTVPEGQKLPPVFSEGFPIIGNFKGFGVDPLGFINRGREKLGGIFTVDLFFEKVTFLIGSQYHIPFFEGSDLELDQAEVYKFMTPIFGKGVVYDAPLFRRRQQYRLLGQSLKPSNLKSYPEIIAKEAHDYFLKNWKESGQIDLLPSMAELIILTASSTLLGKEVREDLFLEVSNLYKMLDQGLTPLSVFFPSAPIPQHGKRDRARKEMVKIFSRIINKRRDAKHSASGQGKRNDLLQKLVEFKYKTGELLTNDEITGLLIAALFAGQHTSSITTTWTLLFLLQSQREAKKSASGQGSSPKVTAKDTDYLSKVLEEISSLGDFNGNEEGKDSVTWNVLKEESVLYTCIKETIRLYPPLIMLMRRVKKSFTTSDGHFVPEGHRVMVSNAISQRLPEIFENPNQFNPDRWLDFDISKLPKYSFIGFGAGIHTCMGESFAFMQIKTILTVMLSMYDIELLTEFPTAKYTEIVVPPKGPNMIKYKRRGSGSSTSSSKPANQSKMGKSKTVGSEEKKENETNEEGDDVYTLEEISKHNKKDDAWLVVNGYVYDITNYVDLHQGGDKAILNYAGKPDATEAVFGPQHPKTVKTLLQRYKIGKVKV